MFDENTKKQQRSLDPGDLVPGRSRLRWAREAGVSVALIDSIATGRRSLTERVRLALAQAAGVPPFWVDAMIESTRRGA